MEKEQNNNENKKDSIKKKSSELKLLIEKYKKTLKEVQEDCNHEPILKLVSENGRSSALRVVCEQCDKIIGYPSQTDNKDFYDN
tara:strand:- start:397 stop:648 length:252 start_codon:yes stop_codon:yes gene_type:complete